MTAKGRHKKLTGKIGETLAASYFELTGYEILQHNWRYQRVEIDLIARKGNTVHFIEVKTRQSLRYGWPEEHIKRKKILRMMIAVEAYLQAAGGQPLVQLDILSILVVDRQPPVFWLIEDVFL